MNRVSNLYEKICDIDNLNLADKKASRGKSKQRGVIEHRRNREQNIEKLRDELMTKVYKTSQYSTFKIYEPKERIIFRLPYIDRIVHHAILNILQPIFVSTFTINTYSCVQGRGVHKALFDIRKAMKDVENTKYCLKMDVQKFFQSIDHNILKSLLRKKFKDNDLLHLLNGIIDSAEGLPLGNYLSATLANFYLTYFDHWLKEKKRVERAYRYCDDIVVLHESKEYLYQLRIDITNYFYNELNLRVKSNYQVFLISSRGLDFLGYKIYHTHTLIRDTIKRRFVRMVRRNFNHQSVNSYVGWFSHCDAINLTNTYLVK